MPSIFTALDIAASSMSAQRTRMNVASTNLANKGTTRTEEGGPYKRRDVVLEAFDVRPNRFEDLLDPDGREALEPNLGVRVQEVQISTDPPSLTYDPGHPDADANGYVAFPAVSGIKEMVNLMGAARAYEASVGVMKTVRSMAEQALRIGR